MRELDRFRIKVDLGNHRTAEVIMAGLNADDVIGTLTENHEELLPGEKQFRIISITKLDGKVQVPMLPPQELKEAPKPVTTEDIMKTKAFRFFRFVKRLDR